MKIKYKHILHEIDWDNTKINLKAHKISISKKKKIISQTKYFIALNIQLSKNKAYVMRKQFSCISINPFKSK